MNTSEKSISTECYPCIFQQLLSLAKLMGMNEPQRKRLFADSMDYLLETEGRGLMVQHLVRRATNTVLEMCGRSKDHDPYADIKARSNELALQHRPVFLEKIAASPSPLEEALKLAAAGNIIDFGAKGHGDLDIEQELASIDQRGFGIYDYDEFSRRLSQAKSLLYLCDNAGEIVLDSMYIREIKKTFPSLQVTCAVRERPIINDAVLKDAEEVGLDRVAPVISSGSVYPGTILAETSDTFKDLFGSADLVVSKGQGNFETLLGTDTDKIFFILRIKCGMMADLAGTEKGNLVLMQNRGRERNRGSLEAAFQG